MRLLVTLEPPVKPRDAFWGGDGEDETAGHDGDDPRSSLERIMQGKTGGGQQSRGASADSLCQEPADRSLTPVPCLMRAGSPR
jgi:hypothetical protein